MDLGDIVKERRTVKEAEDAQQSKVAEEITAHMDAGWAIGGAVFLGEGQEKEAYGGAVAAAATTVAKKGLGATLKNIGKKVAPAAVAGTAAGGAGLAVGVEHGRQQESREQLRRSILQDYMSLLGGGENYQIDSGMGY